MLNKKAFLRFNSFTIGSVIVLILVGSIVRTLGAGMGCPDWPKCFGAYIPPTSVEQLPANYQEIFLEERIEKNRRLSEVLASLGYESYAYRILNDPSILKEEPFNTTKAWVEYINRLVGVVIGLLLFFNLVFSFSFWKDDKWVSFGALFVFILTGFQGWVGSLVVSTNLLHGFITFHMLLAFLILAVLIWGNVRVQNLPKTRSISLWGISSLVLVLLFVQIILGTKVRAIIDDLIVNETARDIWFSFLDQNYFYIHRSFSWLLLLGASILYYLIRRSGLVHLLKHSVLILGLVFMGMILGLCMVRFSFPAWMQPLHLIIATVLFSLIFYLNLNLKISR